MKRIDRARTINFYLIRYIAAFCEIYTLALKIVC